MVEAILGHGKEDIRGQRKSASTKLHALTISITLFPASVRLLSISATVLVK